MATLSENEKVWSVYNWWGEGEEWSVMFGDSNNEWNRFIWPRLRRWLPALPRVAVEIGSGRGRWTRFLRSIVERLYAVDIVANNTESVRRRFRRDERVVSVLGDGKRLPGHEPLDLVFSFDSLVHADLTVMESYLADIHNRLSANGIAFLHHSNMAAMPGQSNPHWRDLTTSASLVRLSAEALGLCVLWQEVFDWWNLVPCLSDAITVVALSGETGATFVNHRFQAEAAEAKACGSGGGE